MLQSCLIHFVTNKIQFFLDLYKTYQSLGKLLNGSLLAVFFLVLIVCVSNVLDLKKENQFEVEKIELTDSEFENDFEEKEKSKESEKDLIISSNVYCSALNSAFLSHMKFINRPTSYYTNIPTPPPDFL